MYLSKQENLLNPVINTSGKDEIVLFIFYCLWFHCCYGYFYHPLSQQIQIMMMIMKLKMNGAKKMSIWWTKDFRPGVFSNISLLLMHFPISFTLGITQNNLFKHNYTLLTRSHWWSHTLTDLLDFMISWCIHGFVKLKMGDNKSNFHTV